jgi:hypothetical protein
LLETGIESLWRLAILRKRVAPYLAGDESTQGDEGDIMDPNGVRGYSRV